MTSQTESPQVLIVGAGVVSLTTATLLQQKHSSVAITLIAAEFPTPSPILKTPLSSQSQSQSQSQAESDTTQPTPSYASMWAGAHYRPIPFVPETHPTFSTLDTQTQSFHRQLAREQTWAFQTANYMTGLARRVPEAGVEIVQGEEVLEDPPVQNLLLGSGDVYAFEGDGFRVWSGREVEEANQRVEGGARGEGGNGRVKWGASYTTYVVNPHIYTAYLLDLFVKRGGRVVQRRLDQLSDALDYVQQPAGKKAVIVNCTGTGLVSDPNTTLIRGQTVLVRRPFHKTITRQCQDGAWSFLIPRPLEGGTIIGGTKQIGDTYGKPRPEERKTLVENAKRYFPEFVGDGIKEEEIVCDNVGFRPARMGGVRIEREEMEVEGTKVSIVHGYGAGGRGYEISFGVAQEVCGLVQSCIRSREEEIQRSRL